MLIDEDGSNTGGDSIMGRGRDFSAGVDVNCVAEYIHSAGLVYICYMHALCRFAFRLARGLEYRVMIYPR